MKMNCWEYKNCGREPGGTEADSLGVCPAAVDDRLDGVHGGKNSGRSCWVIAGTLCEGRVQGTFGMKYMNCEHCDFYLKTKEEEGPHYQLSILLLYRLKGSLCAMSS